MKRLISRAEAAQAGLLDRAGWPVVAAMLPLPGDEIGRYDLRRSLPGYRKACRMLRRSGRRMRRDRMLRKLAPNLYARQEMARLLGPDTFANITPAAYLEWKANGSQTKPFTRADFERALKKWTT